MAPKKQSLLDDGDGAEVGAMDFPIRVNKAFAARFEHNERRKELFRLQSKYPEEAEKLARKVARDAAIAAGEAPPPLHEDDSTEEEEDDGDIPVATEAKIFDTLLRIRRQDPSIYQKDVVFFEEPEEEGEGGKGGKKAKPMYLKDLTAKQAMEYGADGGGSSEDEEAEGGDAKGKKRPAKAYDTEQEGLRKAFLQAATDADGEEGEGALGGVLKLRGKGKKNKGTEEEEEGANEEEEEAAGKGKKKQKGAKGKKDPKQFQQLVDAYFGGGDEINPDEKFLKEYIVNKGWVDKDDDYVPTYHEVVGADEDGEAGGEGDDGVDDEEDERYLRSVDAFEAKYNFRYEEPGADRIVTHPRVVEGTVRKPEDKRRRQREAKKARIEEAEAEAREEVKRLKNLKKQEIESKLDKLRGVAGSSAPAAASLDDVLGGDFDPEEWDRKMAAAFDDDYYDAEDEMDGLAEDLDLLGGDLDDELGMPGVGGGGSDDEDEDMAAEEGAEEGDSDGDDGEEDGKKTKSQKRGVRFEELRRKIKEVDALNEEEEEDGKKGSRKGRKTDPEVAARQRAELQRLLEDYYRLDYEDNVGGVKTRFRYKPVPASTFGLSVDDILRLDDKSLNSVVGIKRLAPYREDAEKMRPNYKALQMVTADATNFQQRERRQNKQREWRKGGPDGGRQRRDKGDKGEAAGAGPGSAAANGAAGQDKADWSGKDQGKESDNGNERKEKRKKERKEKAEGAGGHEDAKAGPGPGSQAAAEAGDGGGKKRRRDEGKEQAAGGAGGGDHKRKAHGQGQAPAKPDKPQKLDPQQARLASYAVPTLKRDYPAGGAYGGAGGAAGAGGKKRKHGEQQPQGGKPGGGSGAAAPSNGPQLSRAQKKNLKRTQKRAEKKGPDGAAA